MEKQAIREHVWDELATRKIARFPFPPHNRIPNFAGAADAADRLATTDSWQEARVVKINPDSPQRAVRGNALRANKTLYMAVPRLRDERCFLRIDPTIVDDVDEATTIGGSTKHGEPVRPEAVEPVDLVVVGSVAVDRHGARIGKGEGYSDLEFAMLREYGIVDDSTPTATTVHDVQVMDEPLPTDELDVPLDVVATPTERIAQPELTAKPDGLDWTRISVEQRTSIPMLARLAPD